MAENDPTNSKNEGTQTSVLPPQLPDDDNDGPDDEGSSSSSSPYLPYVAGAVGEQILVSGSGGGQRPSLESRLKNDLVDTLKQEGEKQAGKSLLRKTVDTVKDFFTGGAEDVAVGEGVEAAEGAAAAAEGFAAAPVIITTAAVIGTAAVGYAAYKNNQAQKALDQQTEERSKPVVNDSYTGLQAHKSLEGMLERLAPEMKGTVALGKNLHLVGTDTIGDDHGHVLDMTIQANRDALRAVLTAKSDEQQKIIDANRSPLTNWIPDAVYLGGDRGREKAALAAQAPYIAALADLNAYEKDLKAQPQPAAQNSVSLPAQTHAPNRASLPKASRAEETLVVGDSIAHAMLPQITGAKKNFAIDGTHLSGNAAGHEGTLAQLDQALAYAKANPGVPRDLVLHVGRNDVDATRKAGTARDNYEAELRNELVPKLKALEAAGVHVVWIMPPIMKGEKDPTGVMEMAKVEERVAKDAHIDYRKQATTDLYCCDDNMHPADPHMLVAATMPEKVKSSAPEGSHVTQTGHQPAAPNNQHLRGTEPNRTGAQAVADINYWAETLHLGDLEKKNGLPPGFLKAVMTTESKGNPLVVSKEGAQGLFQFMPGTAQEYGIDPFAPQQAAEGAARLYGNLSKQYNGDVPMMLAGYNWGPWALAKKGLAVAPADTRDHIMQVGLANAPAETRKQITQTGLEHASDKTKDYIAQIGLAHVPADTRIYISRLGLAHAPDETKNYIAQITGSMGTDGHAANTELAANGQRTPHPQHANRNNLPHGMETASSLPTHPEPSGSKAPKEEAHPVGAS